MLSKRSYCVDAQKSSPMLLEPWLVDHYGDNRHPWWLQVGIASGIEDRNLAVVCRTAE